MTTNKEQGEKLLREAEWIFEKDLMIAVDEGNYNIAVRRAQEVVELALKGCLRILGIDYPKVHDTGYVFIIKAGKKLAFKDNSLREIERISRWLSDARAPSFNRKITYMHTLMAVLSPWIAWIDKFTGVYLIIPQLFSAPVYPYYISLDRLLL